MDDEGEERNSIPSQRMLINSIAADAKTVSDKLHGEPHLQPKQHQPSPKTFRPTLNESKRRLKRNWCRKEMLLLLWSHLLPFRRKFRGPNVMNSRQR